ncbi:MAG: response regulator transcription factor [Anaerolineae bacterium]|nr:MAG: response regulator transcription factor [Anaerolineae bacterium]
MTQQKDILVVEDEDNIREVIGRYLEREGFSVREAADGYAALDAIEQQEPDLIVMDLMLPGIDGLTLTRQVQQQSGIPIIILTARGDTSDRIRGLDWGADDYIPKPFSPRELVSRIHAVLRRVGEPTASELTFGEVTIAYESRQVHRNGEPVSLTVREFDLLWFLASHPGQVFSRENLLDNVWGLDFSGDPSTVTVHMRHLRKKVEPEPSLPQHLITVWGVGYRFEK